MGYWNQSAQGHSLLAEPTGLVWGDAPADIIDNALDAIVEAFQRDLGRRPLKAEIEAGILFSLSNFKEE